jgi:uracil-DNA glycosylase
LTVRAHEPNSHKKKGWERFTDAIIARLSERAEPVAFLLWGGPAQAKEALIDAQRHGVVRSAHPSPLSAGRGFLGSRPFSKTNELLRSWGRPEIDWCVRT